MVQNERATVPFLWPMQAALGLGRINLWARKCLSQADEIYSLLVCNAKARGDEKQERICNLQLSCQRGFDVAYNNVM